MSVGLPGSAHVRTQPNRLNPVDGFTLVEMAVVLLIVTLLLGGLLMPLSAQVAQRNVADTQKSLNEAKEALIGYALSNGYLPCPDVTVAIGTFVPNDGQEDRDPTTGTCASAEGNLPWATLGTAPTDSWGDRFHYRVTSAFSQAPPLNTFSLTSSGDMRICPVARCASGTEIATKIPAVILSYGANGYGAISATGSVKPPPTSADEIENTDGDTTFVSRTITEQAAPAGEFDDLVVWISPNILFNRMVAAGKLH